MSVIRVNKTKDYTVMSNTHFKEKRMSLKAKGLLSLMLSLPDDWDYSVEGLVAICVENETSVNSALKELKAFGYLRVDKLMPNETKTGRIEYVYNIFEKPEQDVEKQGVENLGVEFQGVEFQGIENQGQLNTKESNTKKENTNNVIRHRHGQYGRILLTDDEYSRLVSEFGQSFIDEQINLLDEYIESNNNKNQYKNFNLVVRKSIRDKWFRRPDGKVNPYKNPSYNYSNNEGVF